MLILLKVFAFLVKTLVLLNGRSRWAFVFVMLFAILLPLLDLIFFKILASVFSGTGEDVDYVKVAIPLLTVLFFVTGLKYLAKVRKVIYVNRIVEIIHDIDSGAIGGGINWLRVVVFEVLNSATSILHVGMLSVASIYINPMMGGVLLVLSLISFCVISAFFKMETVNQRRIKRDVTLKAYKRAELLVESRTKSAEMASVAVNGVVLLFFLALLYVYSVSGIEPVDALIFLFLTRFVSSNLGGLASSLMRLSRAWVNVEDKYDALEERVISYARPKKNKIFSVGLQGSGTVTLRSSLVMLGYNHLKYRVQMASLYYKGDMAKIFQGIEGYDSCDGWPWPLIYPEIYKKYPDAKFVLTTRGSEDDWYRSMLALENLVSRERMRGKWKGQGFSAEFYENKSVEGNREYYIDKYRAHNNAVRSFFEDKPGSLVDISWDDASAWADFCGGIGIAEPKHLQLKVSKNE